jgi:predicted dehydrogenase
VITQVAASRRSLMRIGLIGVGRIGAFHASTLRGLPGYIPGSGGIFRDCAVRDFNSASPCTLEDAVEAFCVAEACELSRQRNQPVQVAEVRQ